MRKPKSSGQSALSIQNFLKLVTLNLILRFNHTHYEIFDMVCTKAYMVQERIYKLNEKIQAQSFKKVCGDLCKISLFSGKFPEFMETLYLKC